MARSAPASLRGLAFTAEAELIRAYECSTYRSWASTFDGVFRGAASTAKRTSAGGRSAGPVGNSPSARTDGPNGHRAAPATFSDRNICNALSIIDQANATNHTATTLMTSAYEKVVKRAQIQLRCL